MDIEKNLSDFQRLNGITFYADLSAVRVGQSVNHITRSSVVNYKYLGAHPVYDGYFLFGRTDNVVNVVCLFKTYINNMYIAETLLHEMYCEVLAGRSAALLYNEDQLKAEITVELSK